MLKHPSNPASASQCYPRSVPGRSLAGELARCDREIAAMYAQPPVRPAWITTLGIEDWEAEKRLIQEEMAGTAGRRGNPMLLVRLAWWETVRDRFDDDEKAALTCAVNAETVCPRGVYLDPRRLTGALREKLEGLLNGERCGTANA